MTKHVFKNNPVVAAARREFNEFIYESTDNYEMYFGEEAIYDNHDAIDMAVDAFYEAKEEDPTVTVENFDFKASYE